MPQTAYLVERSGHRAYLNHGLVYGVAQKLGRSLHCDVGGQRRAADVGPSGDAGDQVHCLTHSLVKF